MEVFQWQPKAVDSIRKKTVAATIAMDASQCTLAFKPTPEVQIGTDVGKTLNENDALQDNLLKDLTMVCQNSGVGNGFVGAGVGEHPLFALVQQYVFFASDHPHFQ